MPGAGIGPQGERSLARAEPALTGGARNLNPKGREVVMSQQAPFTIQVWIASTLEDL
ncbi:hypothetical protein MAE02_40060 [Microvirga aerophila]|uniref:Uncharacterized protein n=1 Tax=Microvirga aerophila TaxID=670291 RepID=A0A512BWH4_9HYPH|nr:hypothetical protein MAE02_40060 [Microvirga aerophila]